MRPGAPVRNYKYFAISMSVCWFICPAYCGCLYCMSSTCLVTSNVGGGVSFLSEVEREKMPVLLKPEEQLSLHKRMWYHEIAPRSTGVPKKRPGPIQIGREIKSSTKQ